jgi:hypothetical protein
MVKIPHAEPGYIGLNSGVKGRDKSRYKTRTKNKYVKTSTKKWWYIAK